MMDKYGVQLHLNTKADAGLLQGFDEVALATGVIPRQIKIEGIDHPKVLSYIDVLKNQKPVGKSVALIGAGGIGFDVAEYLSQEGESSTLNVEHFMQEWGVDMTYQNRGAIAQPQPQPQPRQIYLLQRSKDKLGYRLGKTTGWIHRTSLKNKKVQFLGEVEYQKIDDAGLHLIIKGEPKILPVDNVVICAGQEPLRSCTSHCKR